MSSTTRGKMESFMEKSEIIQTRMTLYRIKWLRIRGLLEYYDQLTKQIYSLADKSSKL